MKAFLLAAGYETRLRPITDSVPKCLVPIRGRPAAAGSEPMDCVTARSAISVRLGIPRIAASSRPITPRRT